MNSSVIERAVTGPETVWKAWAIALRQKQFFIEALSTSIAAYLTLKYLFIFMQQNEHRPGLQIPDRFLELFRAVDVTWLIFMPIYAAGSYTLYVTFKSPRRFLFLWQVYTLLLLFRWATMFLFPLEPPIGMIPLKDPIVQTFVGSSQALGKDLFFSGHVATMFMIYLIADRGWVKRIFFAICLGVAGGVLLQKVHYSIDVLVAPIMAYLAFQLVDFSHRKKS